MHRHLQLPGALRSVTALRSASALGALVFVGFLVTSCASGGGYYGFQVDVSNAPPPRFAFDHDPDVVLVAGTNVYQVNADLGYDVFRYNSNWYVNDNGYWYVSADYHGPFRAVSARGVPRRVLALPPEHWHHHPPYDNGGGRRGGGDRHD